MSKIYEITDIFSFQFILILQSFTSSLSIYQVSFGAGAAGALVQLALSNPSTTTFGLPKVIMGGCFCESV